MIYKYRGLLEKFAMTPFWFREGAQVVVVGNSTRHWFTIGSVVTLVEDYYKSADVKKARSPEGTWWVKQEDCRPFDERCLEDIVKELLG
jgi:cytochrome c-type biogenesis protein CcmE